MVVLVWNPDLVEKVIVSEAFENPPGMMTIGKIQGLAVAGFGVTRSPMVHGDPQTRSAQEHPTERLPMADALEETARPARPEPGTGAPAR